MNLVVTPIFVVYVDNVINQRQLRPTIQAAPRDLRAVHGLLQRGIRITPASCGGLDSQSEPLNMEDVFAARCPVDLVLTWSFIVVKHRVFHDSLRLALPCGPGDKSRRS